MNATPACRHQPADGPCTECGRTVPETLVCIACRHPMPSDSRFCSGCGTAVSAPERKPVSVLFVSAHGTAALGAALEPERWHEIVDGFLRILGDGVRAHGGVVDRFTGEGIKAHFGAPVAREGHAIAACRAALELAREIAFFAERMRCDHRLAFAVRMGIHSGDVVYGPIESSLSAQGRTAAVAARIEQHATPGTILLSEATAQLVERRFVLRDLGRIDLRGVRDPVRVYELAGSRSRRQPEAPLETTLPFVGREVEIALMEALLHRPDPAVVAILGEAGVGKTRLIDEMLRRSQSGGAQVHVRLTAFESEVGTPFAFYRRALRRLLGVQPTDTVESARERAAGRLLVADPTIREELPRIFDLLGLSLPGAKRTGPNLDGLHSELASVSGRLARLLIDPSRPRIAVFDDFQWIDASSLAVLRRALDEGIIKPNLAIISQRSGIDFPLSSLPVFAGSLQLRPLDRHEVDDLLDRLLGAEASVSSLRTHLRERCGGNPLFLAELLRSLRAKGDLEGETGRMKLVRASAIGDLPPTLATVLAARVDALRSADRAILRIAATIGTRFGAGLLARAAGQPPIAIAEALARLGRAEIVEPVAVGEGNDFRFRHELLREAALRSMLSASRARLHAAVADALESEADADLHAASIAGHREAAGSPGIAARWLLRAAIFAAPRDPGQALDHLRNAERMVGSEGNPESDRLLLDLRVAMLDLGWREGLAPEDAARLDFEGRRIARRIGDARAGAILAAGHAAIRGMSGATREVVPLVEASRELSADERDPAVLLGLRTTRALALYSAGDLAGVLHECSDPLSRAEIGLDAGPFGGSKAVEYLTLRGTALVDTGRLLEGRDVLDQAIREARSNGSAIAICSAIAAASLRARFTGASPAELRPVCVEGLALAERTRNDFIRSRMLGSLAEVEFLLGRAGEAVALLRRAIAVTEADPERIRDDFGLVARLAGCLLVLRDVDGASAAADRAIDAVAGQGGRLREIEIVLRWAWIQAVIGRIPPAAVEARVRPAMELVAATGARSRDPFLRLVLAWVHRREGRTDEARAETRRALDDLDAMGHWDTGRMRMLEDMRERLSSDHRRRLWTFLSDFGVSTRTGPAVLP